MNEKEMIEKLKTELANMTMRALQAEIDRDLNDRVYKYQCNVNANLEAENMKLKQELEALKSATKGATE